MNGVKAYKETSVATQGTTRLVVMLYDGAIKFLKRAIADVEAQDWAGKGRNLSKAQDIIYELNAVLDMEAGGEVAENLRSLYSYIWKRISEANLKKDAEIIREVIGLLGHLQEGFKAISL